MATSPAAQFRILLEGLRYAGCSETEIAEGSGLSRASLWRVDNGVVTDPALSSYLHLGAFYERTLGVPPPPLDFRRR